MNEKCKNYGRRFQAKGLADYFGWDVQTVYQRVSEGKPMPPSIKVGNKRWWRESEVIEWESQHKVETVVVCGEIK